MISDDGMSDISDKYEFKTPDDYREIDLSSCTPLISAPRPPPVPMPNAQIAHHRLQHLFSSLPPSILPVGPENMAYYNLLAPFPAANMPEAGMLVDSAVAETESGAETEVQEWSNTLYPDPTIFQVSNTNFPESMDQNYSMPDIEYPFNPPETMMPGNELSDLGHSTNSAPETMMQRNNFSSLITRSQPLEHGSFDRNLGFGLDPNLFGLPMCQQAEDLPPPQSVFAYVYDPEFDELAANMVLQQGATSDSDLAPVPALPISQTSEQEQLALTNDSLGDEDQLNESTLSNYEDTKLDVFLAEQDLLDAMHGEGFYTKEDEQPQDQAESTPEDDSADAAAVSSEVIPSTEVSSTCGSTYGCTSRRGKKKVFITEPELNFLRAERHISLIPGPPRDNLVYANLLPQEIEKIETCRRENCLPELPMVSTRRKRFLVTEHELGILRTERYIYGRRRRGTQNAMWALLFPREIERVEAYRRENGMPIVPESTVETSMVPRQQFYLTNPEMRMLRKGKGCRPSQSRRAAERAAKSGMRSARLTHEEVEKVEAYRRENGTPIVLESTVQQISVVPKTYFTVTDAELQIIRGKDFRPSASLRTAESNMRTVCLTDEETERLLKHRGIHSERPERAPSFATGRREFEVTDAELLTIRGPNYSPCKAPNHTIGDLRLVRLTEEEALALKALRDANGDEGVEGDAGPA